MSTYVYNGQQVIKAGEQIPVDFRVCGKCACWIRGGGKDYHYGVCEKIKNGEFDKSMQEEE